MYRIAMVALACAAACTHGAAQPDAQAAGGAAPFEVVRAVLQSPRCVNCHPAGNAPTQGDEMTPHAQDVVRGADGRGVPGATCASCHQKANAPDAYGEHQPPGVSTEWRLPPPATPMVFAGVPARELCDALKDPAKNGGKDAKALLEHVHDPLVTWGWKPGFGRKPVALPYADFERAWSAWIAAGMPCPATVASR